MHLCNVTENSAASRGSETSVREWLVEQITRLTGLLPADVDITQPFSAYGLDSVAAAALSGELAHWLGRAIAPTVTWDYPTIKLLARYLSSNYAEQVAA